MELDDLKFAWQTLHARVDALENANRDLRKSHGVQHVRSHLRVFAGLPAFELLAGLVWTGMMIAYLRISPELQFFLPGLVWFAVGLITVLANAWQLIVLSTLDYSAPVLAIQRKLVEIRILRLRITQWMLLLSPFLWLALSIVGMHGLLHLAPDAAFYRSWLISNALFGAVAVAAAIWLTRRYGERFSHSAIGKHLVDGISGRGLNRAIELLDDIKQFDTN